MSWEGGMTLDEVIEELERLPADEAPPLGFGNPHSYRGYYECLAFQPMDEVVDGDAIRPVTFGDMLASAWEAYGKDFEGYKGGYFTMYGRTECYLASYGRTGAAITPVLFCYMERIARRGVGDQ